MKRAALFVGVSVLCGAVLADCQEGYCLQPYAGADAQIKRGFRIRGSKGKASQANVYAGLKFTDSLGVEIGSHVAKSIKSGNHKLRAHGLHASVLGFSQVNDSTEFFAGVGLSHLRASVTKEKKMHLSNTFPRAIVGLNYKIVEGLSFRPSVVFENSKKLKHRELDSKNGLHYAIGLNYSF